MINNLFDAWIITVLHIGLFIDLFFIRYPDFSILCAKKKKKRKYIVLVGIFFFVFCILVYMYCFRSITSHNTVLPCVSLVTVCGPDASEVLVENAANIWKLERYWSQSCFYFFWRFKDESFFLFTTMICIQPLYQGDNNQGLVSFWNLLYEQIWCTVFLFYVS